MAEKDYEQSYHKGKKTRFKERFKTINDVFDLSTENALFKLITQGAFEVLESPLSIGKEANVFTAFTHEKERVIVKIYRLATCDFNKMYSYIRTDPRYEKITKKKRNVVFSWSQREYRNLLKARECGLRVPTPRAINSNVLVMSFIGDENAAPKLKDLPPKDSESFFKDIIRQMKILYSNNLVHGDLSPFNILNYQEKPVIIDMSQATTLKDPNSKEYLCRDVKNVCSFFIKQGISLRESEILKEIENLEVKQ